MMSNCSNCYNGCSDVKSDGCIRYTGESIEELGINNGDSLLVVEGAIISYLITVLNGTGINITIDPDDLCQLVSQYLPSEGNINLVQVLSAIIRSACDLQEQIVVLGEAVADIEGNYNIGCLSNVAVDSGTHDILQAVITKLCEISTQFIQLANSISTNYVHLDDLNDLIQDYLDSLNTSNLMSNKMIPYVAVEYYGPLSNFNATGAGIGNWAKIYLCNGMNGTPDKRGRVGVGATNMLGINPLDPMVDPGLPGNITYSVTSPGVSTKAGSNTITLNLNQIPSHSHIATPIITDPGHYHLEFGNIANDGALNSTNYPTKEKLSGDNSEYNIQGSLTVSTLGKSSTSSTGISATVTNASSGSGGSHSNVQPGLACYYIIYLP